MASLAPVGEVIVVDATQMVNRRDAPWRPRSSVMAAAQLRNIDLVAHTELARYHARFTAPAMNETAPTRRIARRATILWAPARERPLRAAAVGDLAPVATGIRFEAARPRLKIVFRCLDVAVGLAVREVSTIALGRCRRVAAEPAASADLARWARYGEAHRAIAGLDPGDPGRCQGRYASIWREAALDEEVRDADAQRCPTAVRLPDPAIVQPPHEAAAGNRFCARCDRPGHDFGIQMIADHRRGRSRSRVGGNSRVEVAAIARARIGRATRSSAGTAVARARIRAIVAIAIAVAFIAPALIRMIAEEGGRVLPRLHTAACEKCRDKQRSPVHSAPVVG